jgi:ElaB/YqjD/DUF883 family membrane-anchored ribosome-binding protein
MADKTTAFLEESAADAMNAVSQAANDAKERASRVGQAVAEKVDETRDAAAGALHDASKTLHSQAKRLPRGQKLAHDAADKLDSAAGYMAEHDTSEMIAEAGSYLKRNPGKTLVLGMVLGCTVGWLLSGKRFGR